MEQNTSNSEPGHPAPPPATPASPAPPPRHNFLWRVLFFLKFLEIRLRFVLILVITALLVGYWDHIQNYYERWQRNRSGDQHVVKEPLESNEFEYYCPMHPFVVRNHKDKCPICGMDLSQRKKGEAQALPEGVMARVQVSPDRVMQAGVQVEPVAYRLLTRTVRSYGIIEPDETKLSKIVARFPGRIDELMVNSVGQTVKKGESLARIYSPKYLAAVQEYLQTLRTARSTQNSPQAGADEKKRAAQLSDFARQRLLLAGFTEQQLNDIKDDGKTNETVTLYAPLAGTVLEKNALLGETMEEGSTLYNIADLSRVWVQAQVIESELAAVKVGMPVEVTTVSYPGEIFYGTVDFIYPTVNTENRSVKVRVVVDNAQGRLKPGMYVTAVLRSPIGKYGPAAQMLNNNEGEKAPSTKSDIKLPTEKQSDADKFLANLKNGDTFFQCPMDLEVVSDKKDDCPKCGMHLDEKTKEAGHEGPENGPAQSGGASQEQWAEGYSCEMHPDELSDKPGICQICGCGMKLVKTRVERVPSVPETAVIDTGARQIVYTEYSPGIYDARQVTLGPRAGAYYPVLDGLKLGDKIVARGSFLIDAEARLNPGQAGMQQETPTETKHQH